MLRILIAEDERPARYGMAKALAHPEYQILEATNGREALDAIRSGAADLILLDLNMPEMSGQDVLKAAAAVTHGAEIIVVTANDSIQAAVECMRLGASDYISKPFEVEQLRSIARRAAHRLALERRVHQLQQELSDKQGLGPLIGSSYAMRELFHLVKRAAASNVDVLIRGETGTSKELVARQIHSLSPRAQGPFVAVNTAAVAESLAESELFGHARGAFTGAERDRAGVFEQAHGGTLFLDEIGDMPLPAQTKILRALQERVVQPVGTSRSVAVDVRVISATHQELTQAVTDGFFRQDLYYRIRGIELVVPPLRERREDILLLTNHFLARNVEGDGGLRFASDAVDLLLAHNWPGNVRELEHVIAAACALRTGDTIRAKELRLQVDATRSKVDFASLSGLPLSEAKSRLVESFERQTIQNALENAAGNVSSAARQLGIHRQSLQQKMTQLGIVRNESTP